jgi:hypothetical protein
MRFAYLEN